MTNNRFVTRVTQRVKHVEQERDTLQDHKSSSLILSRVRVVASLIFCVMFSRSFAPFLFTIVISVFFDLRLLIIPVVFCLLGHAILYD